MLTNIERKFDFLFSFLIAYIFFYWVCQQTVFGKTLYLYVSFVFLLAAFGIRGVKKGFSGDSMAIMWMPYFVYTALGYLFESNMEFFSYWLIGLIIMLSAAGQHVADRFNYRLLLLIGLFIAVGVGFNYLFLDLYNATIAPLYYQDVEFWSSTEYGYAGFTYQLSVTACILNSVEMLVMAIILKDKSE